MQINMINNYRSFQVQNHNPAAWMRGHAQQTAKAQDVYGAQCKVTISSEGRKLSKESESEAKSFSAGSAERMLLRAQEQKEQEQEEHTSTLAEISSLMSEIQNSNASGGSEETAAKKQEALQRLIDLKARQEEENKQLTENAASSAAAASKGQQEVDQKNADLYMMLKSFENQEDDEESAGEGTSDKSSGTEEEKLGSVGEQFDHAASALGASAAKREMQATAAIDELMNDGYDKIARADAMMHEVHSELNLAMEAAGKDNLSEEERRELVSGHLESANGLMRSNYDEMRNLRGSGIQETKDARELELKHIQLNPLDGVAKAKQTILDNGVDAARNEVSQGTIEKASDELEQRVQDLIDKRNDITSDEDESDKTQEAEEKTDEEQNAENEVLAQTE